MKKLIGIGLAVCALATACGGGGGDDGGTAPPAAATYMKSGGLTWSATTDEKLIYPPGLESLTNPTLERTASAYCTQQTCDKGGGNCRWTNFNGEAGWRLPTLVQLKALYAATPKPAGWTIGPTWSSSASNQLDFATGQTIITGSGSRGLVTCIKPD